MTAAVWRCPDGGTCHHQCERSCFRVGCCAPLSDVYPEDLWPPSVVRFHARAATTTTEVEPDYPMRSEQGLVPADTDRDARAWAFRHYQQGHRYRVWAEADGGPVVMIVCSCGHAWTATPQETTT